MEIFGLLSLILSNFTVSFDQDLRAHFIDFTIKWSESHYNLQLLGQMVKLADCECVILILVS